MSDQKIFIEGFGNIVIREGIVRIGLVDTMPAKSGQSSVRRVGGLAMSVPAFLNSFEKMRSVVEKLESQGLISKRETTDASLN